MNVYTEAMHIVRVDLLQFARPSMFQVYRIVIAVPLYHKYWPVENGRTASCKSLSRSDGRVGYSGLFSYTAEIWGLVTGSAELYSSIFKLKLGQISADNVNILCQRTLKPDDFIVLGGLELVTNTECSLKRK
jgi:hypothetical protein